jgi:hypothetical protein
VIALQGDLAGNLRYRVGISTDHITDLPLERLHS